MTAYDTPRDPIADLHAACDRITAARRPAPSTPLEFAVPALAGYELHRAAPDVALDDQAKFQSHALSLPPAGWSSAWVMHPDTIVTVWRRPPREAPWLTSGSNALTELPAHTTSHAPVGVLVPVYLRPTREESQ
jgi:hypothetical protein